MKITIFLGAVLSAGLLAGCATDKCEKWGKCIPMSQPKVTKQAAQEAALARVPGTVKGGELEKYKGRFYWSFDITTKGSTDITEVAVDPDTGKVVWMGVEKPASRQKH